MSKKSIPEPFRRMKRKELQDRWNYACNEIYEAINKARGPLALALKKLSDIEVEAEKNDLVLTGGEDDRGLFDEFMDSPVPDVDELLSDLEERVESLASIQIAQAGDDEGGR